MTLSRRSFLRSGLAGGTLAISAAAAGAATLVKPTTGIYVPGTYSAKASGIGNVVVTMTFDANRITDVVLNVSEETPTIGQAAAETLKKALMAAQASEIDAVSGATITSKAVMAAAKKCIQQAKGEIPVEVVNTGKASDEDPSDWLGQPPEIAESQIRRTVDADIVVVGCGTGGLFAVCAAAEAGAKVIGIDRFATGTGVRGDLGALNSRYQKEWGTKIDKFDFVTMATQYAAGHINQDLVKLFCDESGKTIDWYGDRLAERGVELWHESGDKDDETRWKHYPTGHSPRWGAKGPDGKKLDGNAVLVDYARKLGARFDYETRMVKLERADGGRVTGLIAETADGYVRYRAKKGVIVATGGYGQNYAMMEALQPWNLRVIGRNGALPGAKGDGIRACLWVGAAMDETHSMMLFDRCALRPDQPTGVETAKKGDVGFFWIGSQPWLKVNADGKRFFNESGIYEGILHADEYQKGHCHYSLFDSDWVAQTKEFKMHGCSRVHPFENGADPNIHWKVFEEKMLPGLIEKGFVQKADTIAELAKKLGLPAAELEKTVKRYNELAAKGVDEDYGKEAHRLAGLTKPPFYGAKNTGYSLCTMDGIKINTDMNALDTEGNPIPGLYVVGNDSGGFFANTYPNLVTGMACGRTVTFGRLVGLALAKA